jgi:hypothetical protein
LLLAQRKKKLRLRLSRLLPRLLKPPRPRLLKHRPLTPPLRLLTLLLLRLLTLALLRPPSNRLTAIALKSPPQGGLFFLWRDPVCPGICSRSRYPLVRPGPARFAPVDQAGAGI